MTTAEILAADAETHTDPWWEDGRNVTFVARWFMDRQQDKPFSQMDAGAPTRNAEIVIGIYETPWEYDHLWVGAFSWVIDSLDKEQ